MTKVVEVKLGFTLRIAAIAQFLIPEKTMTDLTLRREEAELPSLPQLLKDLFSATPLGLVLAAFARR